MTSPAAAPSRTGQGGAYVSRHAPVFLLAPARSCSTVCLALLAGHPGLYGFPELLAFEHPAIADLLAERDSRPEWPPAWSRQRLRGVCRAIAQVHESTQDEAAIGRARGWLDSRAGWTGAQLLDHLLDEVAPRTGLEKSPETSATDRALASCLAAFPRARFIHLTRHPADTQRSMRQHWSALGPPWEGAVLTAHCASAWYLSHLRIMRALDKLAPERWIRIRAEDLLRDPHARLPAILDWLGLGCSTAVIDTMLQTERWPFAGQSGSRRAGQADRARQAGRAGGGDPKFLAAPWLRPPARPGPVTYEPELGFPAEMQRRMTELARQLGYCGG